MDGGAYLGSPFNDSSSWQLELGDAVRERENVATSSNCNVRCGSQVSEVIIGMKQEECEVES